MAMTLREVSTEILKGMDTCNLSKSTIKNYTFYLEKFNKQAEENCQPGLYSMEVIESILDSQRIRLDTREISRKYYHYYCKTASLLEAYTITGSFVWERMLIGSKYVLSNKFFQAIMENATAKMMVRKQLAPATVDCYRNIIRKFCSFLESEGVTSFSNLTTRDLIRFIESIHETNKASMAPAIGHLKTFIDFLNHQGLCTVDADISILKPVRRQEKNIIYFTKEEIHILLNSFTFDERGLRDYAILLLAIHTGMRRSDICNLRLQDISWVNYTLDIRQKKTGRKTTIPLVSSAGNAIAAYILHERPQTTSEHIFLIPTSPIRPLAGPGADAVVKRRCKQAGVEKLEKCTIHSFRRSLGTWLSQESEPVEEIAQCLGHANVHSVDRYVFASPSMQDCCLGFKGIEPKGWSR
ncbi:MAG: tyrosine-type recombinase/integrase [Sphaerochaeta sp.]